LIVGSAAKTSIVLILLFAACGGSALSLEEYVERMQTTTDELEAAGEQFVAVARSAVDPDTGAVVDAAVLQGLLDDTVVALDDYFDELGRLEPPSDVEEAHNAFVTVAAPRLEQWRSAADRAGEIESFEELATITLKNPEFTATCEALEQAVGNHGLVLDLDCD
jgi:hypothetical protein